ncbi:MAG: HAMP domain-containing sensor histidine kinase [Tissierellia bacterium]|nr:HAMP domain-containing sensor histidine kinase [Tissierellia bacterium]
MDIRKKSSLRTVFYQYFFSVVIAFFLILLLLYGLLILGFQKGIIYPANQIEQEIFHRKEKIAKSQPFDELLLPKKTRYLLLSKDEEIKKTNMSEEEIKDALSYFQGESVQKNTHHLLIPRNDGSCIIQYPLRAGFTNERLDHMLYSVDRFIFILFVISTLSGFLVISFLFSKRLNKQLRPILDATEEIQKQNLDFQIQSSRIQEFNHILQGISEMKETLKESLEKQWREEELKKEQISALAHDIKTPLTIIRGNVELLQDRLDNEDDQESIHYAIKNIDRMENYLALLIDLTRMDREFTPNFKEIPTDEFLKTATEQMNELIRMKSRSLHFEKGPLPKSLIIDENLILRALLNITANALEYSNKGEITLKVHGNKNIHFTIIDEGSGFSPEDLKYATEGFYCGHNHQRTNHHYGIGLYITKRIAEIHNGRLELENEKTKGAKVSIHIPQ